MTWLQYAALTWQPAFSIGIPSINDQLSAKGKWNSNTFPFCVRYSGGGHTSEDHGSTSESLNIYPEACGGENSDMLESARLSVSLEGDENFRVCYFVHFLSFFLFFCCAYFFKYWSRSRFTGNIVKPFLWIDGRQLRSRCELSRIARQ